VIKINLNSNLISLRSDFITKIDIPFDYFCIYLLRFLILKLFRKPLPHFDKFMILEFRDTLKVQRINKTKSKIAKLESDLQLLLQALESGKEIVENAMNKIKAEIQPF
jgi:hypothetical protein